MKNRIGMLVLLIGVASCGGGGASNVGTTASGSSGAQSGGVSGDMVPFSLNTTWTYQTVNAASPYTVTLHANNNNPSQTDALSAFVLAGTNASAIGGNAASSISQTLFLKPTSGSFNAVGVARTRNGSFPIPGSPELVPNSLFVGQKFTPYMGVTGTVVSVGDVRGAAACTTSRGATVAYTFQSDTYDVSFVPGCGITDFVTNTGVELRLISIGTSTSADVAAAERSISQTTLLDSIRNLTNALFRH